jgi:hypothetical protein
MPADASARKKQMDRLWSLRGTWEENWQLLGDYLLPRKSNITKVTSAGQKQTDRLFDSTGVRAPEILAASLAGTLTSPAQQWFGLTARQEELNEVKTVRDWLEDTSKRTYLALNNSNFNSEVLEVFLDLAVFGTGAMLIEEGDPAAFGGWGGLRFKALTIGEYVVMEAADGKVDTLCRKFKMTVKQIVEQWPKDAGSEITAHMEREPDKEIEVAHCVYPREDRKPSKADKRNMPWASLYFEYAKPERVFSEGGFEEFPYVVPRWAKTSGETYGRGPGYTALPDIRTLNRLRELTLIAGAKAVDPPLLQLNDGVTGSISLEPAAINIVTEIGALSALESKARWDVAEYLDTNLKSSINSIFYTDFLRLRERPGMTATEVLALQEEFLRLLGPTSGRLHSELLTPGIARCIALQYRAGALLPPPPELLQGGDIDIQFEGPLARAQRSRDLTAIERTDAWVATILDKYPEIVDIFDWDKKGKLYAEVAGMPSNLLRDEQQVAALRQARMKVQQQAAQLQAAQGIAQAGKDAGAGIKHLAEAGRAVQSPEGVAA